MKRGEGDSIMGDNGGGGGCGCGCLIAIGLVAGLVYMSGGIGALWQKTESLWAYDSKKEKVERIFDENQDGVLQVEEQKAMYKALGIPTIEGELPRVKIPYETLDNYFDQYGQR